MRTLLTEQSSVTSRVVRPSVLAITSELPWPLNTGGHIRTFHLMKSLAKSFDVRLVSAVDEIDLQAIGVLRAEGVRVCQAVTGPRRRLDEIGRVVGAALKHEPYVMFHRHSRRAVKEQILAQLRDDVPDVVYLDHIDPFAFRDLFPQTKLVVDLHNVYSKLAARVADERRWPANWYLAREARLLAATERRIAQEAAALLTVSSEEQTTFEELGNSNVHLVPNGVDCSAYSHLPVGRSSQPPVLLYLGALSWQPNAKAAEFLARDVLPQVREHRPDAILQIVGRNPGPDVQVLSQLPGVEVHANVPDVGVFLERATLLAVALDSGGGTRLKILEAFAAGLPVVTTPVGCEGIDVTHGRHCWIAERPNFASAIVDLLAVPELTSNMAEEGRLLARRQYDWPAIGEAACRAVESVLE